MLPSKKVKNILVNVFDHGINEKAILNTKRMFAYAETEHRFLDSGGFQLHEAEKANKVMEFNSKSPLMNSHS